MQYTGSTWGIFATLTLVLACAKPAQPVEQPAGEPSTPASKPSGEQPADGSQTTYTPEELCKRLQQLAGKDENDTGRCIEELESRRLQDTGVYSDYALCVIAAESTEAADACEE